MKPKYSFGCSNSKPNGCLLNPEGSRIIFLGLQAWWIVPIINKNNKLNKRGKDLRDEINQLEKLYKK